MSRARYTPNGYTRVTATPEEIAEYRAAAVKKYGRPFSPPVGRLACTNCGRRIWGSGLGIGSHTRHCPATLEQRAAAREYFRQRAGLDRTGPDTLAQMAAYRAAYDARTTTPEVSP